MRFQGEVLLRLLLVVSIIILLIYGCAAGFHVDTYTNDDGMTISNTIGNEIYVIGGGKDIPGGEIIKYGKSCFLDVKRCEDVNGNVTYFLLLKYIGPDWFNIDAGPSLTLVIDDETKTLSAKGPLKKQKEGNSFTESLDYSVSHDVLIKMINAEEIKVMISGEHGDLTAYFTAKNFTTFRRFVNEFAKLDA
ncbi:MAG: hypothetical protein GTO51_06530 [Candidatus Latescibacteria bacterium]|nr:hypothetical protein [Candidatus Latescibacterota bacterium]NIM21457.1 hypothetical protein [Candidatus Latescibacterota bacterium]NIM65629.1 hypothetical protein [Candidatus Latescibacterota bacterium]NIO02010.1 hypothetical protein [Candidatus Latescibacterota bacterium]NIO28822.1 hypothetical protein [Candidatus Latescibacterota bacterium]